MSAEGFEGRVRNKITTLQYKCSLLAIFPTFLTGNFLVCYNNAAIRNEAKYSTIGRAMMRVQSGKSAIVIVSLAHQGWDKCTEIYESEHSTLVSGGVLSVRHTANSFQFRLTRVS
jgi:hypothetical protein